MVLAGHHPEHHSQLHSHTYSHSELPHSVCGNCTITGGPRGTPPRTSQPAPLSTLTLTPSYCILSAVTVPSLVVPAGHHPEHHSQLHSHTYSHSELPHSVCGNCTITGGPRGTPPRTSQPAPLSTLTLPPSYRILSAVTVPSLVVPTGHHPEHHSQLHSHTYSHSELPHSGCGNCTITGGPRGTPPRTSQPAPLSTLTPTPSYRILSAVTVPSLVVPAGHHPEHHSQLHSHTYSHSELPHSGCGNCTITGRPRGTPPRTSQPAPLSHLLSLRVCCTMSAVTVPVCGNCTVSVVTYQFYSNCTVSVVTIGAGPTRSAVTVPGLW